jgi:hypothetical protein
VNSFVLVKNSSAPRFATQRTVKALRPCRGGRTRAAARAPRTAERAGPPCPRQSLRRHLRLRKRRPVASDQVTPVVADSATTDDVTRSTRSANVADESARRAVTRRRRCLTRQVAAFQPQSAAFANWENSTIRASHSPRRFRSARELTRPSQRHQECKDPYSFR